MIQHFIVWKLAIYAGFTGFTDVNQYLLASDILLL